jgi:hypothetical protein
MLFERSKNRWALQEEWIDGAAAAMTLPSSGVIPPSPAGANLEEEEDYSGPFRAPDLAVESSIMRQRQRSAIPTTSSSAFKGSYVYEEPPWMNKSGARERPEGKQSMDWDSIFNT